MDSDRRAPETATSAPAYEAPAVRALLAAPHAPHREVPRAREIFVNRNLRMDRVEAVGFDMDYTLAMYHLVRLETLAFRMTLELMVRDRGYPAELRALGYDPEFVIRGVVVDKLHGNIFKMDRHNHVGRCYHGRRPLPEEELRRLYRDEKIHLSSPRFAWIDTLFALPEACLFAEVIERLEADGGRLDYSKLFQDIRESIDTVHRDGSLKVEVKKDLAHYVVRDPELGPALHKLRSGGKKLFLLTNSLADYTDEVMRFVLDRRLEREPLSDEERDRVEADRRHQKAEMELLRRASKDAQERVQELERGIEDGLNRYWGLTFKEGNENSRFGEQIEVYACIYTSRVSNFVFYSPMQYFRSPRAAMPHERAAPARISPWGDAHAAPVAGDRPSKASKASR